MMARTRVLGITTPHAPLQDWKESCGGFPDPAVGVHMIVFSWLSYFCGGYSKNKKDLTARRGSGGCSPIQLQKHPLTTPTSPGRSALTCQRRLYRFSLFLSLFPQWLWDFSTSFTFLLRNKQARFLAVYKRRSSRFYWSSFCSIKHRVMRFGGFAKVHRRFVWREGLTLV